MIKKNTKNYHLKFSQTEKKTITAETMMTMMMMMMMAMKTVGLTSNQMMMMMIMMMIILTVFDGDGKSKFYWS